MYMCTVEPVQDGHCVRSHIDGTTHMDGTTYMVSTSLKQPASLAPNALTYIKTLQSTSVKQPPLYEVNYNWPTGGCFKRVQQCGSN